MNENRRVGVIGAGVAGLTAARRLKQAGITPVVLEAGNAVGGRSRSLRENGAVFDLGAWTFPHGGAVHSLALELGLGPDMAEIPATIGRFKQGRFSGGCLEVADLARPLSLVGPVVSLREAPAAAKLKALVLAGPGSGPDESAGAWAARHFSESFARNVLAPVAALFFLQELGTLSRNALMGTLRYLGEVRLMGFRNGMGRLAEALAADLDVRLNAAVESVSPAAAEKGSAGLELAGSGFRERVDGLVLATDAPSTARLLAPFLETGEAGALASLRDWPYAATLSVRLLLVGRWPASALQVLPPRDDDRWAAGLTLERAKHPHRVPADMEAVSLYPRPDRVARLLDMTDEAITDIFAAETARWMGVPRVEVAGSGVHRWRRAAAFMDPFPTARRQAALSGLSRLAERHPIRTAGDWLASSGLEGAVTTGESAAQACIGRFRGLLDLEGNAVFHEGYDHKIMRRARDDSR